MNFIPNLQINTLCKKSLKEKRHFGVDLVGRIQISRNLGSVSGRLYPYPVDIGCYYSLKGITQADLTCLSLSFQQVFYIKKLSKDLPRGTYKELTTLHQLCVYHLIQANSTPNRLPYSISRLILLTVSPVGSLSFEKYGGDSALVRGYFNSLTVLYKRALVP